jgi:3-methyladenine DNA glycosylase AlkD
MNAKIIIKKLKSFATPERKKTNEWFFKTGKGEYSEHDKFIGIRTPQIRQVAKQYFKSLTFNEINELINHPIHEVRHCGLIILVNQYQIDNQDAVFNYYIDNIHAVNNWDLVDTTAPQIVGDYLYQHQEKLPLLFNYLHSSDLWERRIAIVATWTFIKHDEFAPTLKIAKLFLIQNMPLARKGGNVSPLAQYSLLICIHLTYGSDTLLLWQLGLLLSMTNSHQHLKSLNYLISQ